MRALMLVAAVDVQHNRLEFEAVAYAPNGNSWSVWYEVIPAIRQKYQRRWVRGRNWTCCLARDWPTSPAGASADAWRWRLIPGSRGARMATGAGCTSSLRRHPQRQVYWSRRHRAVYSFRYRDSGERGNRRCVQA